MKDDHAPCRCKGSVQYGKAIGTTDTPLIGPNSNRIGVTFSSPSLNRYCVSFGSAAVLDVGYTIHPGNPPLTVTREQIGESIEQDIHAIFETTGETIALTEHLHK